MSIRRCLSTIVVVFAFVLSLSAATSTVADACEPQPIGICSAGTGE